METMFEGILLKNVHDWMACQTKRHETLNRRVNAPRPCVIHKPSLHHMRLWPLTWRDDRGIFERQCEHKVGHPDPDQFDYWDELGMRWEYEVHGCDGCCSQSPLTNRKGRHVLG